MNRNYLILGLALVCLTLISACTSQNSGNQVTGKASENVVEMTIDAYSYGFTQSPATIKQGDKVRIKVTSSSGTHGVSIPDFGVSTGPIPAGQEEVFEFVADKSGSFDYFCNIPCGEGHRSMKGKIVVE